MREEQEKHPNFCSFLDWASTRIQRQPGLGDTLSRLAELWKEWVAENGPSAVKRYEKLDPAAQREFLDWLARQPEFAGARIRLAPYQLAQCDGFRKWDSLRDYSSLADEYRQTGVHIGLVRYQLAVFKKLTIVLIPRTTPATETTVQVWPVNFRADHETRDAFAASVEAALDLPGSAKGWLLFGLLLLSSPSVRCFRKALVFGAGLRRTLGEHDCYALIDIESGEKVDGKSAGLACALALLLAAARTRLMKGKKDSTFGYAECSKQYLPRLEPSRITGAIQSDGGIEKVGECAAKLVAMEGQFGVLPEKSLKELGKKEETRATLRKLTGVCRARSLAQVLRWLMGWPSVYAQRNCALIGLLLAIIGAWYAFDVTDRYFRPAPDLDSVETSLGPRSFDLAYVQKEDIPVRRLARITLYLLHPRADGGASVQVRAEPRPGQEVTYECLQIPTERLDWHPEIMLAVQEGKAVFDYRYESNPGPGALASATQVARESLTIIIWRNGRAVRRYPLTLVVR